MREIIRILQSTLIISSIILLNACGGGSSNSGSTSDSQQDTNQNNNNPSNIGSDYGYYVDAAIKGIKYECGDNIGLTDTEGKFIFEKGLGCTFYLGNIELRTVESSLLKTSGVIIRETDTQLAILLQSLDYNNFPDDGIEIPEDIQAKLEQANITYLPSNNEELKEFINAVGGTLVQEDDAIHHMMNEKLKTLITGKTLYYRNIDYITKISFSDTGDWVFETENYNIEDPCNYVIKNGLIEICSNNKSSQKWILSENTDEYVKFNITYMNNSNTEERVLYFNRKIPDDELTERIGTYPLIAGKTFYQYCYIDNSWSFVPIHFNTDKNITIGKQNKHYRLDPDYNLYINDKTSVIMYPGGGSQDGIPNYTNNNGIYIYMAPEDIYKQLINDNPEGLINYQRGANFCNSINSAWPVAPAGVFDNSVFQSNKLASKDTCSISYYLSVLKSNNKKRTLYDESFVWSDVTNACHMFFNGDWSTFPVYLFE